MKRLYVLFWLNKSKASSPTKVPIYCRITVSDDNNQKPDRKEVSTGKYIDPERWEYTVNKDGKEMLVNDQKVRGNKEDAVMINRHLDKMKMSLDKIFQDLEAKKEFITAAKIKAVYGGTDKPRYSIVACYKNEIQKKKDLCPAEFTESYIEHLESECAALEMYIKEIYKTDDVYLEHVDYKFINGLEFWGKTDTKRKWVHNTAMNHLRRLKHVTDSLIKKGFMDHDPFKDIKIKLTKPKFKYLTEEELKLIEEKTFEMDRLSEIRDIFIFSCYTALAFSDVEALTPDHLTLDVSGNLLIMKDRQKTEEPAFIPLLDKPKAILEKYKNNPIALSKGRLLPVLPNQIYNRYLKEIATLCGINKNLTTHVARHTAATFLLNNNVPERTICEIMGIASAKVLHSTYGKLLKRTVINDMAALNQRINENQEKLSQQG